jgi:translation initiation factor 2B subunit (eIF-2B alpha/beta/delta family)
VLIGVHALLILLATPAARMLIYIALAALPFAVLQVLVGAHAVLANGGVIAPAGVHMVALAAKRHSIPFVVLVGLHKLSPLFPHDPDVTFNGERARSSSATEGVGVWLLFMK